MSNDFFITPLDTNQLANRLFKLYFLFKNFIIWIIFEIYYSFLLEIEYIISNLSISINNNCTLRETFKCAHFRGMDIIRILDKCRRRKRKSFSNLQAFHIFYISKSIFVNRDTIAKLIIRSWDFAGKKLQHWNFSDRKETALARRTKNIDIDI